MTNRRRVTSVVTAMAAAVLTLGGTAGAATTAEYDYPQICEKYGSTQVSGGRYVVQNSEWNDDLGQCITPKDGGFTYDSAEHDKPTNGAPASYPSIYEGCHFGVCSQSTQLPRQVSQTSSATTSVSYTTPGYDKAWNAAYDVWFDADPYQKG